MTFNLKVFFPGCLLKSGLIDAVVIVSSLHAFCPLPAQAEQTAPAVSSLEALISSSFAGSYKTQIAKEGSDLQYLARTFYGVQLGWPLVWFFNIEAIPDPERIKAGTEIRIPRLKSGLDEKAAFQVLESAYILAYKRYLSLANRSDGQRRWVLTQAVDAGCDLTGTAWDGVLTESDQAWSESRGIKVAVKKTVPLVVAAEPLLVADLVAAAFSSDESSLGVLAAKFEKAGKLDDVIADLETKATAADAPPEVFLALSILYGRKGLRTKEYAALASAETAAARPGVKFNAAVVYGRKQLLAGAPDAESFMVGSIEVASVPEGAVVFIDGIRKGVTPILVEKVKAGVRKIRIESDGYQSWEAELAVDVGAEIPARYELKGNPGSVLVKTVPAGALVWLEKEGKEGVSGMTPFIFENVETGEYSLRLDDQFINDKDYYLGPEPQIISVLPGKQTVVNTSMVRGRGILHLAGFPEGSQASLDGKIVDALAVFGEGLALDSGRYRFEVTAPTTQKWKGELGVREENTIRATSDILTYSLPRRTVKIDGLIDDWTGLLPVRAEGSQFDPFPKQSGTKISDIYMCRDDKYLYWRIGFSDGSPTAKLSADIKQRLLYNIQIFRSTEEHISLNITFDRGSGSGTHAGLYNFLTKKGSDIASSCIQYKFGDSVLEARISLNLLVSKLPKGAIKSRFSVAQANASGIWIGEANVDRLMIDYYE